MVTGSAVVHKSFIAAIIINAAELRSLKDEPHGAIAVDMVKRTLAAGIPYEGLPLIVTLVSHRPGRSDEPSVNFGHDYKTFPEYQRCMFIDIPVTHRVEESIVHNQGCFELLADDDRLLVFLAYADDEKTAHGMAEYAIALCCQAVSEGVSAANFDQFTSTIASFANRVREDLAGPGDVRLGSYTAAPSDN